jgi:hypothetical protein
MSEDVSPILKEWDSDPDSKKIRKIIGSDGKEKIQLRVPFGLLQLEADGRPDGKKYYGKESLLEHYISILNEYKREYKNDEGFKLDHHDCERLQEESLQYYHRYVSLFEIEDYIRAERDTARNIRVLDMIKKYAERQEDAISFEKYRPYIIMMNARAKANIFMNDNDFSEAIKCINETVDKIIDFYKENELSDDKIRESQELAILRTTAKEIRDKWENT